MIGRPWLNPELRFKTMLSRCRTLAGLFERMDTFRTAMITFGLQVESLKWSTFPACKVPAMSSTSTISPVGGNGVRGIAQPVAAPLARAAIFLVVSLNPEPDARRVIRGFCPDLSALLRAVGFRDIEAGLSCVMGIGSDAWERLFGAPRPAKLHPFKEIRSGNRHAVATPGDMLFHIRAKRMDLCFELATQIMARIGDAVSPADEVHGFRFFDDRDLIGFVDGTENPTGQEAVEAVVIGDEDPQFAGGSYVVVQKYLHDLKGWNALSTEAQERIIGRKKLSDIELDESVKPTSSHSSTDHHRRGRKRGQNPARQHALRTARGGRVWNIFHWLQPVAQHN